ncbi:MAG: VapC toxin family PIN domain ribonuclease [Pseudomonadota bacterium]
MLFGCQRLPVSRKRQKLEQYLYETVAKLPILPYCLEAAEWHAKERARLSLIGKTPPFVDGQIAAIAKVNDLIIVTANVSDYQTFSGIIIENWFMQEVGGNVEISSK